MLLQLLKPPRGALMVCLELLVGLVAHGLFCTSLLVVLWCRWLQEYVELSASAHEGLLQGESVVPVSQQM